MKSQPEGELVGRSGLQHQGKEGAQGGGSECQTAVSWHQQTEGDFGRQQEHVSKFPKQRHKQSEVAANT